MPMTGPIHELPLDVFSRRRERVFEALGDSVLVLPAAEVRYASRDTEYPYRPDRELYWATGVREPEAVALLRGHADEERFVLFVPPRDEEAELWSGPREGPEGARERHGADVTRSTEELEERFPGLVEGARSLHYRLGGPASVERLVEGALRRARSRGLRRGDGPRSLVDPGEVLDDLRLVKDGEEVERMRRAARLTAEAHVAAMERIRPGAGEWEVQAELEAHIRRRGGEGPAYPSIVASGPNACVLHYVANGRRMEAGDLVLIDAGASLGLYAADITRTSPVGGAFTTEQRDVYQIVEEARRAAVGVVAPGATVADVHDAAVRRLVEGLVGLGVLDGPVAARVEDEAYQAWFPHRTSHWLGLDVHDPGDYARGGRSRRLEPGMVLTVEPGLYFRPGRAGEGAGSGAERRSGDGTRAGGAADRFTGIGVRIEDDVLVTEAGHEVLTSDVPTDPDALKARVG